MALSRGCAELMSRKPPPASSTVGLSMRSARLIGDARSSPLCRMLAPWQADVAQTGVKMALGTWGPHPPSSGGAVSAPMPAALSLTGALPSGRSSNSAGSLSVPGHPHSPGASPVNEAINENQRKLDRMALLVDPGEREAGAVELVQRAAGNVRVSWNGGERVEIALVVGDEPQPSH